MRTTRFVTLLAVIPIISLFLCLLAMPVGAGTYPTDEPDNFDLNVSENRWKISWRTWSNLSIRQGDEFPLEEGPLQGEWGVNMGFQVNAQRGWFTCEGLALFQDFTGTEADEKRRDQYNNLPIANCGVETRRFSFKYGRNRSGRGLLNQLVFSKATRPGVTMPYFYENFDSPSFEGLLASLKLAKWTFSMEYGERDDLFLDTFTRDVKPFTTTDVVALNLSYEGDTTVVVRHESSKGDISDIFEEIDLSISREFGPVRLALEHEWGSRSIAQSSPTVFFLRGAKFSRELGYLEMEWWALDNWTFLARYERSFRGGDGDGGPFVKTQPQENIRGVVLGALRSFQLGNWTIEAAGSVSYMKTKGAAVAFQPDGTVFFSTVPQPAVVYGDLSLRFRR